MGEFRRPQEPEKSMKDASLAVVGPLLQEVVPKRVANGGTTVLRISLLISFVLVLSLLSLIHREGTQQIVLQRPSITMGSVLPSGIVRPRAWLSMGAPRKYHPRWKSAWHPPAMIRTKSHPPELITGISSQTKPEHGRARSDLRSSPPRKVAFVIEPTPFTHVSGYANRYQETLKYFDKAGDDVQVITPDDSKEAPANFLRYPITTLNGFRFLLYKQICLSLDLFPPCRALGVLSKFKPELVHVASPGILTVVAAIYAKLLRIPLVLAYHTHLPIYARQYLGWVPGIVTASWIAIKLVHSLADLTLVTSPQMKAEFEDQGISRVQIWNKGVDTNIFNPRFYDEQTRMKLTGGHPEAPLLLYVGRLGVEKRLKELRDVLERVPDARLAIVGAGPEMDDLKMYFSGCVDASGQQRATFTGLMQGEALSKAFASSDVFLMPSDSETLGFVVLEAMASGVPVIGANAGGIPNLIINGQTGYLNPVGDMVQMATRVQEIIGNEELKSRLSQAARTEAKRWDWESSSRILRNDLYKSAIEHFRKKQDKSAISNFPEYSLFGSGKDRCYDWT